MSRNCVTAFRGCALLRPGLEIRKIWRWPKMATARVSAVAMATAKLAQQKWALLKWSLIQRSLHQFLNYWKAFWMGFIEFTKMAITSLKIGHFHPDFAQLRWPFLATVGLSGGGHCGGQLAWPPRISRHGERPSIWKSWWWLNWNGDSSEANHGGTAG